jgi:hypothetical protein
VRKGLIILGDLLPDPATGVPPSESARRLELVVGRGVFGARVPPLLSD